MRPPQLLHQLTVWGPLEAHAPRPLAHYSQKGYMPTKKTNIVSERILVSEQDIINTYSKDEQFSCQKYFEYKKLIKENPTFGYKKCAKLLGVPQGRTRWWHTKGKKKAIPLALKAVQKLRDAKLIPFTEHHKDAKIIFNMLGVLFGDGGVDKRLNTVAFISSDKRDIDLWKFDFENFFPFAKNKIQIVEGGEYGHSYNIRCWDRSVILFFVALGVPVGDKVATKYTLPKYIFEISRKKRIAFLDGLFAAEISVPRFRGDLRWSWTKRFTDFSFGMSKIDFFEEEHNAFLNSIKRLSKTVGLTTTPNLRKEICKPIMRKDGNISYCYRIFFQTHHEKVLEFNEQFELRYAKDKKEQLENQVWIAKEHKRRKNSEVYKKIKPQRETLRKGGENCD